MPAAGSARLTQVETSSVWTDETYQSLPEPHPARTHASTQRYGTSAARPPASWLEVLWIGGAA